MDVRLILTSLVVALVSWPAAAQVGVGDTPAFSLTTLEGVEVSQDDLDGQVVILDFWATWCGPCIASIPHMQDLYETYHEMGVEVYGVSLDEDRQDLDAFLATQDLPWPIVHEAGWGGMAADFGVDGIPSVFILSPAGEVVWQGHPGRLTEDVMNPIVARYLGGDMPRPNTGEVVMEENAELNAKDPRAEDGAWMQAFTVELEAGKTYQIDLSSEAFDTYLTVQDPSGEVRTNDDGPSSTDSQLVIEDAEAGVYTLFASSFNVGESGAFVLRVREVPVVVYDLVLSEQAALDEQDSLAYDGKRIQVFEVELDDGAFYRVDLLSDQFDAYLTVHSPSGEVWMNDDGLEGRNARLMIEDAEAGVYKFYATSYSQDGRGDFEFEVRRRVEDAGLQ